MSRGARVAGGVVVGAVLAWLLFRGTDWSAVRVALQRVDRGWIAFALLCTFSGQFLRAGRLMFLLGDSQPVSYRQAFNAAQIGMLMNVLLPMRIGEGVRVLVLVRDGGVRLSTAVASTVVDRVADMSALFVIACTAVAGSPAFSGIRIAPGLLQNTEAIEVPAAALTGIVGGLSAVLSVALVGLALMRMRPRLVLGMVRAFTSPLPVALSGPLRSAVGTFSRTAGHLASGRAMARAFLFSLAAWGCGIGSLYGLLSAFGFDIPWAAPFLILSLIAAFVAAPITPGLVGQYHVPVLAGVLLVQPTVDPSTAKAATILAHLLFLVPIAVLAVAALSRTRLSALDLLSGSTPATATADTPRRTDGLND